MLRTHKTRFMFLLFISGPIFLCDQITKYLAVKHLTYGLSKNENEVAQQGWSELTEFLKVRHPFPKPPYTVITDYWHFHYVENSGAAWGLMQTVDESFRAPFFLFVSIFAMFLILAYYFKSPSDFRLRLWALAFVFGGAIGNFVDRTRMQYVVDFIEWHYKTVYYWPTFNIADSAISVGVVLLLIDSFVNNEQTSVEKTLTRKLPIEN